MKKLKILIVGFLALCMSFSVIGQVEIDSTSYKSDQTVQSSPSQSGPSDQALEKGQELLKSVAIGTGGAMKTGYEIVVKQQYVYAAQYCAAGLLAFISLCGFVFFFYFRSEKKNSFTPAIIFLIVACWSGYTFATHFNLIMQAFLNPEYAAIADIVKMTEKLISK